MSQTTILDIVKEITIPDVCKVKILKVRKSNIEGGGEYTYGGRIVSIVMMF